LRVIYVVKKRSLRRADTSSKGVLLIVVSHCVRLGANVSLYTYNAWVKVVTIERKKERKKEKKRKEKKRKERKKDS